MARTSKRARKKRAPQRRVQQGASPRPSLDRIAAKLDALYAELPKLDCKGLCVDSCIPVDVAPGERKQIQRDTGVELPSRETQLAQGCSACVALKEGRCTVYEVRPLICRLWGIDEGMKCPHGCEPEGGWLTKVEAHRLGIRTFMAAGFPPGYPKRTPLEWAAYLRIPDEKMAAAFRDLR